MRNRFIDKIGEWYFTRKALPYWIILAMDCAIVYFSNILVFWLLFRGAVLQLYFWPLLRTTTIFVAVDVVFFKVFHTYSGVIRYSSLKDLLRIAEALFSAGVVIWLFRFWFNTLDTSYFIKIQLRILIPGIAVAIVLMCAARLLVRMLYESFRSDDAKGVFIYGVQDGGISLAKSISDEKPVRFRLKGFISHDKSLNFNRLLDVKVYRADKSLTEVLRRNHIEAVLVAPKRNDLFRCDAELQNYILDSGARIYMGEDLTEWNKDEGASRGLSEVKIEDLLPREQIVIDIEPVMRYIAGRRVMVTGSAGSIGSEIVRQVASLNPSSMLLVDQAETPQHDMMLMMAHDFPGIKASIVVSSVVSSGRMRSLFETFRPEVVFHAAAYKHVPMMEDNPSSSIHNNVKGTKIVADLSVEYGVEKFIMISTDKAVNPTNVMGCSKRICEIYVQSLDRALRNGIVEGRTEFVTTRFGNVLGSNGSVIPIFRKQIAEGGPVTVTHPDIIRYFMLIPEACRLVLEAAAKGKGGEILAFDMGHPVRIADLAQKMIYLSGAQGVEIKYTGLRKGEKLFEEVLSSRETTKPSFNDKIRVASVREYDFVTVNSMIEELISIADTYDAMASVAMMKKIVPEYKSKNSIYSELDERSSDI